MAEDLPPNLDDGELWLPSDVICAVGACRHHHHRVSGRLAPYPNDFGAMDDLAGKLAAFGLLERRRDVKSSHEFSPKPELCGKERAVFFFSTESVGYKPAGGQRSSAVSANSVSGGGTGAFFPFSRTVHKSHPGIPVECQKVDGFHLERARVLQRQHKCHGLTRYMPVRQGGSGRESAGTGVFLPRAVNVVDSNKKPWSVKGIVHSQQRQPMWNPMVERQASRFLPAAEMGLPPDWTY